MAAQNKTGSGRKIWIPLCIFLGALVLSVGLFLSLAELKVRPVVPDPCEIEVDSEFQDPGAEVLLGGIKVCPNIHGTGRVDTGHPGRYPVTYSASFLWKKAQSVRQVSVEDHTPPVITLVEKDSYTLPGHPYREEGFSAHDNLDGDLTDKVQRREEKGVVIYAVTDSSGNRAEIRRNIRYGDFEAPVLKLAGGEKMTMRCGGLYFEPGFSASDNADGNMTKKVKVTHNINPKKIGRYEVRYTVSDSSGNKTEKKRLVEVLPPLRQPDVVRPGGKVIYLTFDDGPSRFTPRLLQVLKKYNVKATFFVVGVGKLEYLDDIVEGGHSIGIHTMTHDYKKLYSDEQVFMEEVVTLRGIIREKTGVDTTLLRFPGGSSNTVSRAYKKGVMTNLVQQVTAEGYQYFDWNVSSGDAGSVFTKEAVYRNVVSGVRNKNLSVVLQHDRLDFSVDAVEAIIQWGLENGYTFLPLTPDSPAVHHGVNN